jgi:hypothetical protein
MNNSAAEYQYNAENLQRIQEVFGGSQIKEIDLFAIFRFER